MSLGYGLMAYGNASYGGPNAGGLAPSIDSSAALSIGSGEFSYAELALDPVTWDLATPIAIVRGVDAIVQRMRVRLRFFLGEWFLDQRLGVPYYRDILVKNPDPILVRSVFRTVITETPGVKKLLKFSASLDKPTRTLTTDFVAQLVGDTVLVATNAPFIVG